MDYQTSGRKIGKEPTTRVLDNFLKYQKQLLSFARAHRLYVYTCIDINVDVDIDVYTYI